MAPSTQDVVYETGEDIESSIGEINDRVRELNKSKGELMPYQTKRS